MLKNKNQEEFVNNIKSGKFDEGFIDGMLKLLPTSTQVNQLLESDDATEIFALSVAQSIDPTILSKQLMESKAQSIGKKCIPVLQQYLSLPMLF